MAADFWSKRLRYVAVSAIIILLSLLSILHLLSPTSIYGNSVSYASGRYARARSFTTEHRVLQDHNSVTSKTASKTDLEFQLRQVFNYGSKANRNSPRIQNVCTTPSEVTEESIHRGLNRKLRVRPQNIQMQRMVNRDHSSINTLLENARVDRSAASLPSSAWTVDDVPGPNVTDRETVLSFARMAADAYVDEPGETKWQKVGCGFNYTEDFGWEGDGLRGHIFADTENKTVVIGLKGTSPAVFDGSDTTTNDKENDNLFFSCCCGQGGQYLWRHVCSCMTSTYTCNSTCVVESLKEKNRYYYSSIDLYRNVTEIYPDADIWLSGHSLGGSVASLLGLTYGLPVVTFEAPGEALAASRLGLPTPPEYEKGMHQTRSMTGGHHFGHTADPIYMGSCNSASSFCTLGGYALETVCHTGQECTYDTVRDLGWRVATGTHRIELVIQDVIEKYNSTPQCRTNKDCTDCFNWKYFESNGTESTTTAASMTQTSSTSTSTQATRTQTCKTPGWWGCLDESTSTTATGSSSTSEESSSTTCHTPGWFGCKDPTTTTTTTTTTATDSLTTTVTRTREGDDMPGSSLPGGLTSTSSVPEKITTGIEGTGYLGSDIYGTATSTGTGAEPTESHCVRRNWYGRCKEWEEGEDVEEL